MNKQNLKGNWNQMKGKVKEKWGELTDDELDQIKGDYDKLIGKIQEKYGHEKAAAREKVDKFLEHLSMKPQKHEPERSDRP